MRSAHTDDRRNPDVELETEEGEPIEAPLDDSLLLEDDDAELDDRRRDPLRRPI